MTNDVSHGFFKCLKDSENYFKDNTKRSQEIQEEKTHPWSVLHKVPTHLQIQNFSKLKFTNL